MKRSNQAATVAESLPLYRLVRRVYLMLQFAREHQGSPVYGLSEDFERIVASSETHRGDYTIAELVDRLSIPDTDSAVRAIDILRGAGCVEVASVSLAETRWRATLGAPCPTQDEVEAVQTSARSVS